MSECADEVSDETVAVSDVYDGPTEPIVATPESNGEIASPSAEFVDIESAPTNEEVANHNETSVHEETSREVQVCRV